MNDDRNDSRKFWTYILIITIVAVFFAMGVMIAFSLIKQYNRNETNKKTQNKEYEAVYTDELIWKVGIAALETDGYVIFPGKKISGVEQDIEKKQLKVFFDGEDAEVHKRGSLMGDWRIIDKKTVRAEYVENQIVYSMDLREICSAKVDSQNSNRLDIRKYDPDDKVLFMLDVEPVVENSDDIIMKIAKMVQHYSFDKDYEVMIAKDADSVSKPASVKHEAKALEADYYLKLNLAEDTENRDMFGMYANANLHYKRGYMENVDYADIVLKKCAQHTNNKAHGVFETQDESVLNCLSMPAAEIYLGYTSNEWEKELLVSDEYIEEISFGILEAFDEIYQMQLRYDE